VPSGDDWLHEQKYDGYRLGCLIDGGEVRLISRRGNDWTAQFPEVVAAAKKLPVKRALLDGEVAIVTADGRTSFQELQRSFDGGPRRGLTWFVFDLIHLDGEDVGRRPLEERKAVLRALLERTKTDGRIQYADHLVGGGSAMHKHACELGMEGVVSKRRDMPYRPGRSSDWVKTKCVLQQEFVIGGWLDPRGSRTGVGALLLGYYDAAGRLVYAGKVGTGKGWTVSFLRSLRARLEPLEQPGSPFAVRPQGFVGRDAHWTRPELVCEVAFTEWTAGGNVRHETFLGLREDKRAREVVREVPAATPTANAPAAPEPPRAPPVRAVVKSGQAKRAEDRPEVSGIGISKSERRVFPELGVTKLDLARYYEAVGPWMVPHVAGRPLTLVRCAPDINAREFMHHGRFREVEHLRQVDIPEQRKVGQYFVADTSEGLVALAQLDIVEVHTWNSRVERVEQPDRLVFDLDPGPEVRWAEVVATARLLRSALQAIKLESWVKTTGGKGLHVVVPLVPELDWTQCLAFTREVARVLVQHDPDRFTLSFAKAGRERKILIDYLRNNRTNTSVAAYSVRARPGATVSVPIHWDELSARLNPDRFTLRTVPRRLRSLKVDPWKGYWITRHRISGGSLGTVDAR